MLHQLRGQPNPANVNAVSAWSHILGVSEAEVFVPYFEVVSLIDQVETQVAALHNTDASFVSEMPALRRVMTNMPRLGQPLQTTIGEIQESAMVQLAMASSILSSAYGEEPLASADEQLGEIREEIRELLDLVEEASGVDREVRFFLIDHLRQMDAAIGAFKIAGPDGLRRVIDSIIGEAVRVQPKSSKEAEPFWDSFWRILGRVGLVASLTFSAPQIGHLVEQAVLPAHAASIVQAPPALPPGPMHTT